LTDLQIPVAGLPISVLREYDTRYGIAGSFGYNGRLDYEAIKIEKNVSLATGWTGKRSGGLTYYVIESSQHLVTVNLSDTEKYYFQPIPQFKQNDGSYADSIVSTTVPRYQQGNRGRVIFQPVGSNLGSLDVDHPSNMGYDDNLSGWVNVDVRLVRTSNLNDYDPDFSHYTFVAPNGTSYGFNGDGTVAWKQDRNGNRLTFAYASIAHSTGKQVTFTRDGNNYVTEIYDPIAQDISGSPVLKYSYDDIGNLTNAARLVERSPETYQATSYAYTNTAFPHHVTSITDARGIVSARYEYDSSGRMTRQYDALSRFVSYGFDLVNRRQTVTDRLTNTAVQTFTYSGQLASLQDPAGNVTQYGYDESGRKIAETNALGQVTSYTYDSSDNLTGGTDPIGASTSATYNDFGEPLAATDALGYATVSAYDAKGNLIASTNALGIVAAYGYDTQGNRTSETNALGLPEQVVRLSAFNEFGWLTNSATLDSQYSTLSQTACTYDSNGNRLTENTARTITGGTETEVTQTTYDAANRIIQTIDPLGFTNRTVYDPVGKTTQTVDKLGRTNFNYFDVVGLLTNTTSPDGLGERYVYDAEDRRTQSIDRAGRTNLFLYDALGRVLRTTRPDGSYSASVFDAAGRLRRTVQGSPPAGIALVSTEIQTRYFYDAAGRQTATTNALNQGTILGTDANGNQTNSVDALGRVTAYQFDALNRQTEVTFPDGTTKSFGYDGLNRRIAETNQAGIATIFAYDALDRLSAVTNALGTAQQVVTLYSYDEAGNLTAQIDGLGRTNSFEYDARSRRTKHILPGGQNETFGYDAVNNLTRHTNFNGVVITNQYDVLNRLTNRSSTNGYRVTWAYSPTGQRTNMVDASGTNTYIYDNRDRLVTKQTPQGSLAYTYEPFGNLATVESSATNGTKLNYYYDSLNRLIQVTDRFGNSATYVYDPAGNLKTERYSNNVTNMYSYNLLDQLTNISAATAGGVVASFAYTLAPVGNRTNLVQNLNGSWRTNVWRYDPLLRLTNETCTGVGPTGSVACAYDLVGNRTSRSSTLAGITNQSFTYTADDQLTAESYDANGNATNSLGNACGYDAENRLASINGGQFTYVYDGDGHRVRRILNGTLGGTNLYLVDDLNPTGHPQVLEELAGYWPGPGFGVAQTYTYGLRLVCQHPTPPPVGPVPSYNYFCGYDGQGSVRFLTDDRADISDTYAYDAFGTVIASSGITPNHYLFAGEHYDDETGFYYLRARHYNPETGRFLTRDTDEGNQFEPARLHSYSYAADSPVDNVDPSGNEYEAVGILTVISIGSVGFAQVSSAGATALSRAQRIAVDDLVLLETHPVGPLGHNHAYIVMIVNGGSKFYNDARFKKPTTGRGSLHYATIGAASEHKLSMNPILVSNVNRPTDVNRSVRNSSTVIRLPSRKTDDEFIERLLDTDNRYPDNLPYDAFPHGNAYNSNGYVSGLLLEVTGAMPPSPLGTEELPGFNHPVPSRSFE
jgi:RHS repeat-associated protein